jgi:hypothetical protein
MFVSSLFLFVFDGAKVIILHDANKTFKKKSKKSVFFLSVQKKVLPLQSQFGGRASKTPLNRAQVAEW